MGIAYANYNGPKTPGGGDVLNLFPALAIDTAGHVYMAWIDATNFALYYAFSTDEGRSWSAPVRVNSGGAVTNEFDWAQGARGHGGARLVRHGQGGPGRLGQHADSSFESGRGDKVPVVRLRGAHHEGRYGAPEGRPDPLHFQADALWRHLQRRARLTTDPTADRQMADFFGFDVGKDGGLRIVFNDTTNEFDGAGLHFTRQVSGTGAFGSNVSGRRRPSTPSPTPRATRTGRTTVRAARARTLRTST